ncbi:type IV pili twitching motility protein PilT [Candidatus Roizmanbacteria bacterium RIFCSPLOWO2_01_FULL_42_14]|uniref:Type IV pili twitching motility protein PilT n=4 Tax=Candidatus Roizmaniibacteriota TaxID=1752723 RepID=A0A1F7JV32_9BACT|nr:MAG: type IV pili twitching motility protein PilT [Candidatus Roizmanbacteria bacterium RIFCSPHIGHO2_02_FULL_43_11]OGK37718.1 MAG: type IV pili twitching motility protein PilT [Candidatus Roizmanbacteria bacterium RIFCSPHIGHO2_12_FULL_42_10]OGK51395.1 MAG: type IV pili twitching motility protein PilT [Candidatus Roizmanbacteria bacterium RIFCSPLOWO2_01_FULL_42_14]OGK59469.1 MAG: type IV pili twitching motility protein PilT [Candidatus Roizmanbacteria bacterium RIFCSPLOWO2_02_FULL_43_10]
METVKLEDLFQIAIEKNASDIHILPGYNPSVRINGELYPLRTYPVIDRDLSQKILLPILTDEQKGNFMANKEIDFGYQYGDVRFRINMYHIKGAVAAAFRLITSNIRSIDALGLPEIMHSFTTMRQGFVLITGPTGEGKSTSLAAILQEINLNQSRHILTIEDPIEYVYPQGKSIISQRELGQDTHGWSIALKSALREDPDVVLVGEMRDYETIQAAMTIAETGHLVFSTLHTNSVPQTIDRIVDVFPPQQQNQVRIQLASTLRAVISQRLVPNVDNSGRIPGCEILISNAAVASTIREGKTHMIDNILETSSEQGMVTFERYLSTMYAQGKITKEVALNYAIRPEQIKKYIS